MVDGNCHHHPVREPVLLRPLLCFKQLMEHITYRQGEVSLSQSITLIATGITGILLATFTPFSPKSFMYGAQSLPGKFTSPHLANGLWLFYFLYLIAGIAAGLTVQSHYLLVIQVVYRKWGTAIALH